MKFFLKPLSCLKMKLLLRMFPPLRAKWAFKGQQAKVAITGQNAQRTLFGTIDLKTAKRVILQRTHKRQDDFQNFMRLLRKNYRQRPIALLLDRSSSHQALKTLSLAPKLRIQFIWLPKQWSELNAMDQLWKELKRSVASNRQFEHIDLLASQCESWVLQLTPTSARRKAGMLSDKFWLKHFCRNF